MAVGLPALEIFLDQHGEALADGSGFPKRFGLWFWGNGVHAFQGEDLDPFSNERVLARDNFRPIGTGKDWEPNEESQPLTQVRDNITIVSGLDVLFENSVPHGTGPAGVLSGRPIEPIPETNFNQGTFTGPTLDQIVASQLGGETRFRSLEVSCEYDEGGRTVLYTGPGQALFPEYSPMAFFTRLFGTGFAGGADFDEEAFRRQLESRKSVLDTIKEDATALDKRLGKADKVRIERHFESIRALEQQIAVLESNPPLREACVLPSEPASDYPAVDGRLPLVDVHHVFADLVAMALACDLTRVATIMFSNAVGNPIYGPACVGAAKELSCGHHELTHNEPGDQPTVQAIIEIIMNELVYFVNKLDSIEEGDGTLLDHCVFLATTDTSNPKAHSVKNYPLILAGGASGALVQGIHYQSPGPGNVSSLGLTLLRAMGIPLTEFGAGAGYTTSVIGELLT